MSDASEKALKPLGCPNPWCSWKDNFGIKSIHFVQLIADGIGRMHCWCGVDGPTEASEAEALAALQNERKV